MFCVSFFAPFTHFNMIFLVFHIFRYFRFPRLRCEYPLWCGDWLHKRWLHSNGNRRKYEVEIHKKNEEIQMEIRGLHLFPKWKLFSLQNVLISFERKHWRKGNGRFQKCGILHAQRHNCDPSRWFFVTTYCNLNKHKNTSSFY